MKILFREGTVMSKFITDIIGKFELETPSLQNQHKRMSFIGVLPIQANSNYSQKNKDGVEQYWAQLLVNFSSAYNRTDESGQIHEDNKSLKTLVISFPMSYLSKQNISTHQFKDFFDTHYICKKFLILPVSEEKQAFQVQGDKKIPIKNQTKVEIDPSFDLKAFMDSHKEIKK
jgi:hypothetical protein